MNTWFHHKSHEAARRHITAWDHLLAVSRNEWRCIDEEERWESSDSFPTRVLRHHAREDVFHRDRGRMIELGYGIENIQHPSTAHPAFRVTYRRSLS